MVFERLVTIVKRISEDRREEPQQFNFTINNVTDGIIRDFERKGRDVPSYRLYIDSEDARNMLPDYLKFVEIRKERLGYDIDPFTERIILGYQQGHTIRFKGEYTRNWMTSILVALFLPNLFVDFFEGRVNIEDRNTSEEIDSFKTTFVHLNYQDFSRQQPIAALPNVRIEQGIAKHLTDVGLDPSTTPYNEEDFLMIYHCESCGSGGLYSQPRISEIPIQKSIKCRQCGSGEITRVYQNF